MFKENNKVKLSNNILQCHTYHYIMLFELYITYIDACMKETKDWNAVIRNMKQGKDVHIQENCKSEKLNIVAGEHYDFGQYLINVNSPKWCKENTDGKQFMQEVAELKRSHDQRNISELQSRSASRQD